MKIAYERGLHELGDGLYAYLQPDGGWGWSNAGLIAGDGDVAARRHAVRRAADARHARRDAPGHRAQPDRPGDEHARQRRPLVRQRAAARRHPDHRQRAALEEMRAVGPRARPRPVQQDRPRPGVRRLRGAHLAPLRPRLGHRAAAHRVLRRAARAAGRRPRGAAARARPGAHAPGTRSPTCPTRASVFTGDILFIEGTPIMWEGPVANWLARVRPDPRARRARDRARATARSPTRPACATSSAT